MADAQLIAKVQNRGDLELALLTGLIANEHCVIDTEDGIIHDVQNELEQIVIKTFGLTHAVVVCSGKTTLDDFANGILVPAAVVPTSPPVHESGVHGLPAFGPASRPPKHDAESSNTQSSASALSDEAKMLPNIIIATHLDKAPKFVQIQALELMRTKRIFTRTAMQTAPKDFLLVSLVACGPDQKTASAGGPKLTKHLNDYVFISHFHGSDDDLPHVNRKHEDPDEHDDRADVEGNADDASIASVVRRRSDTNSTGMEPRITIEDITTLRSSLSTIALSVDVRRYLQNLIHFLRMHRFAGRGSATPTATRHFLLLARCLAALHGRGYVAPALVALAMPKVYAHRVAVVAAEDERSLQYGSRVEDVRQALRGVTPRSIVEDVLGREGVEAPL